MYNRNELEAMNIASVKKVAIAKANQNREKTSWVQSTPKDALIEYILGDSKVPKQPETPSPTPKVRRNGRYNKEEQTRKPQAKTGIKSPTQQKHQAGGSLEETLANMVLDKIKPVIDDGINTAVGQTENELIETFTKKTDDLQDKVDKKISTLQRPVKVYINDVETKDVGGLKHKKFPLVLECLKHFKRVWLCGPSGTGKSYLVEQCAESLGFTAKKGNYEYLKGSAGVTESHMTGRMTFDGTFIDGAVSRSFRNGNFLCLDEFDGFDANAGLVFNSVFDNQGILSTPNDKENPFVLKDDGFHVAVASNTWGDGNDFDFAGRGQLDLATLDRLQAVKVYIDYDKNIERALAGEFTDLADILWDLRRRVNENSIRRTISSRLFLDGQTWRLAGKTNAKLLDIITTGWTREELDKVDYVGLKKENK